MFYESDVEQSIIDLLQQEGYQLIDDSDNWVINRQLSDFINHDVLLQQLSIINPNTRIDLLEEAISVIQRIDHPSLFERNKQFHKYLVDGITVDDPKSDINPLVKLIDFNDSNNNLYQVAHQIKFREYHDTRIPDVIVFINGLPLVVMELKGFEDGLTDTDLEFAYRQLGANSENSGYRYDIPTLFNYNAFEVISDGVTSKVGVITSKIDRFNEWKSINGEPGYDENSVFKINTLIKGLFNKDRIIDVIQNGIFYLNKDKQKPVKIMCQYHQYFGVLKSMNSVKNAIRPDGDGRAGILWHTQGSGKSFSMVMLAHRLITNQELNNPTIVVLTDRIDLDSQLYSTFAQSEEFLRTQPVNVTSRKDLLDKLSTNKQGGVILTTIGKFDKEDIRPNERNNIIVMADEAHRGHYGIYEKVSYAKNDKDEFEMVVKYGTEKYIRESLPNATFIGFTGTPITTEDKSTSDIYGDIIDVYDMSQSVNDGATVRIFYEGRLAKIWTDPDILKQIDEYYDELEESGEATKEAIKKSKDAMSSLKKILEDDDVVELLAKDIIEHYEGRKGFLNGKAMIVVSTRLVAMKLYHAIINLRPDFKEIIAPIVTESNKDSDEMRELFKDNVYRQKMAEDYKKDNGKLKIAIVVDMWLTGFDVPDLDVMYIFKRMKSHNLMQAIARVNRVYPGKDSGLVVDYIGLSKALDRALDTYTARDKEFNIRNIQDTAKVILLENLSIFNEWFTDVEYKEFYSNDAPKRFKAIQNGAQFVLENEKRKDEFMRISISLKRAFIVSAGILSNDERENVQYYLSVRSFILKLLSGKSEVSISEMNQTVAELLADAIKGDEVKVITKLGSKGDEQVSVIDLLRKEKIEELRKKNPPHIFIKLIEKLLEQAIAESRKNNYFKSQEYSERLIAILKLYHNRDDAFDTTETIVNMIAFAEDVVQDEDDAKEKGLAGRERAFYDALIRDKNAIIQMPDATLKLIAHELKETVEEYATTDWSKKRDTRALMRVRIKRLLKKYNYPPEYTETAIKDVITQAEYMMSER